MFSICTIVVFLSACSNDNGQDEQTVKTRDEAGQICANPNNFFSACGLGSADDPFIIDDELQLVNLSDPANQSAA